MERRQTGRPDFLPCFVIGLHLLLSGLCNISICGINQSPGFIKCLEYLGKTIIPTFFHRKTRKHELQKRRASAKPDISRADTRSEYNQTMTKMIGSAASLINMGESSTGGGKPRPRPGPGPRPERKQPRPRISSLEKADLSSLG